MRPSYITSFASQDSWINESLKQNLNLKLKRIIFFSAKLARNHRPPPGSDSQQLHHPSRSHRCKVKFIFFFKWGQKSGKLLFIRFCLSVGIYVHCELLISHTFSSLMFKYLKILFLLSMVDLNSNSNITSSSLSNKDYVISFSKILNFPIFSIK